MRMLVIYFPWLLLTIHMVCSSVPSNSKPVLMEVFQIEPILKTDSIISGVEVEYNLNTDSITLPSGVTCKYQSISCYDHIEEELYYWTVYNDIKNSERVCRNFISIYNTSFINGKTLIHFEFNSSEVSVHLTHEENICSRNFWFTNQTGIVVALVTGSANNMNNIDAIRKELDALKEENAQLRATVSAIQNILQTYRFDQVERKLSKRSSVSEQDGYFFGTPFFDSTCKNYVLFPCENVFVVLVTILYVVSSLVNTVINYYSLKLLKNKKKKYIFLYSLNQALTARYICRTQSATKMKVDKWLLDIETPFK